ncbi:MAG: 2-phospho-L-lactate guanylyltransferase [Solirubrobacterales bacterium]
MNSALKTCAILPLKPFDDAKERLATGLDAGQRRLLAEAMARDVVAALGRTQTLGGLVVISAEPKAAEIAGAQADAILEDAREGHSAAARLGVRWAIEHEFDRVVMIPGDCPLLDAGELDELLAKAADQRLDFVVVPDRMGGGTNALVIRPPDKVAPSFGPGSRERHLALGLAAGARTAAIEVPTLALDLDTAEDLVELAERVAGDEHDAINTEQAIATLLTDRRGLPGGYAR